MVENNLDAFEQMIQLEQEYKEQQSGKEVENLDPSTAKRQLTYNDE